jgi:anti-anti-sigma factor
MTISKHRQRLVEIDSCGLNREQNFWQLVGDQPLAIKTHHGPGYVLVTVTGEIDIATATPLCERLSELAAGGGLVVADLDQLGFIDAAGLGALARAARQAAAHGGRLHVICNHRQTRLLFRLTGLDRTVLLARTLAEAVGPVTAKLECEACETSWM